MRGYFGVGIEQSSKPMNAGNLFRTAHAFGASFLFTVNADYSVNKAKSDTSVAPRNVPWYDFSSAEDLKLPGGCALVGVEFLEDAVELPVFRHPATKCISISLSASRKIFESAPRLSPGTLCPIGPTLDVFDP